MHWLNRIPLPLLLLVALPLALAPWPLKPDVHVWEKLVMLFRGELVVSTDIFDLILHGIPAVLLVARAVSGVLARTKNTASNSRTNG